MASAERRCRAVQGLAHRPLHHHHRRRSQVEGICVSSAVIDVGARVSSCSSSSVRRASFNEAASSLSYFVGLHSISFPLPAAIPVAVRLPACCRSAHRQSPTGSTPRDPPDPAPHTSSTMRSLLEIYSPHSTQCPIQGTAAPGSHPVASRE